MKGRMDLRFEMPDSTKVKSRLEGGKDFTKDLKTSICEAVVEILNSNAVTVRSAVLKSMASKGWASKKEAYSKQLEHDSYNMLRVNFMDKASEAASSDSETVEAEDELTNDVEVVNGDVVDDTKEAEASEEEFE